MLTHVFEGIVDFDAGVNLRRGIDIVSLILCGALVINHEMMTFVRHRVQSIRISFNMPAMLAV